MIAAGLGLGGLTVLVLLLWIISPYPDSGAGGALHIAADLWLLGHGSQLIRTETLSGVPAPVALTPLLLMVLPVSLLYRACLRALVEGEDDAARLGEDGAQAVFGPVGWVACGYLLTSATAVVFASGGPVRADVISAVVRLPFFVVCVAAAAAWVGFGRGASKAAHARKGPDEPDGPASHASSDPPATTSDSGNVRDALVENVDATSVPPLPVHLREAAALVRRVRPVRTVLTVTAVLCAGGLVLTLCAVLWRLDAVRDAFPELAGPWPGQFAVFLLVLALLPNAAVWGAAYGLGPGFALGAGTVVAPLTEGGNPQLPPFPLLAALPESGAGGPFAHLAAVCVPLAAGVALGRCVARAAVPEPGRREGAAAWQSTTYVVGLAACGCGAAVALLAACSGGAIGTQAMAFFGPSWWLTGLAATGWTAAVGLPAALAVRSWRLREHGSDDDWHATSARQARWAALKTASGGLMPDFEPRRD